MVDLQAATRFMAGHARLLDRRRLDVILHGAPADGALAALSAYSNPDGGYGWGLEADLRATESQPGGALHAFAVQFLDTVCDAHPEAHDLLARLARHIPADGLVHVGGGLDEEFMRPLDFAPDPDRPARELFARDLVAAELARLAGLQQADGG